MDMNEGRKEDDGNDDRNEKEDDGTKTPNFAPRYHGAWSISLPLGPHHRQIRLILLKYLERKDMSTFEKEEQTGYEIETEIPSPNAWHLDKQFRLHVVAGALEAWNWLRRVGIRHRDLEGKNMLVVVGDKPPKVVVVNYGIAVIWERTIQEARRRFYRPSRE